MIIFIGHEYIYEASNDQFMTQRCCGGHTGDDDDVDDDADVDDDCEDDCEDDVEDDCEDDVDAARKV